jgi:hypothetical protein
MGIIIERVACNRGVKNLAKLHNISLIKLQALQDVVHSVKDVLFQLVNRC